MSVVTGVALGTLLGVLPECCVQTCFCGLGKERSCSTQIILFTSNCSTCTPIMVNKPVNRCEISYSVVILISHMLMDWAKGDNLFKPKLQFFMWASGQRSTRLLQQFQGTKHKSEETGLLNFKQKHSEWKMLWVGAEVALNTRRKRVSL